MNKNIVIVLLVLGMNSLSAQATFKTVSDDWAPYQFTENGKVTGFAAEIVTAVLNKLSMQPQMDIYPWKRCLALMETKAADGIFLISRTPEREAFLTFPAEPIINVGDAYFFLKTQNFKRAEWGSLKGVMIGLVDGYEYADSTMNDIKQFSPDFAQEDMTNFRKLQAGRIGMALSDKYVGLYTAKKMGIGATIDYLQRPYQLNNPENDLYFAFLKTPANEALARRFTEALRQLKTSGEYQRLMAKYLP